MHQKIYDGCELSIGQGVSKWLTFYLKNPSLTKKGLYEIFEIVREFLPKPHKLPNNKYYLTKFLEKIMPPQQEIIKKHRICEKCSYYLGEYNNSRELDVCETCESKEIDGIFVEYDLKLILKNAFETRNLGSLINLQNQREKNDSNYIYDISCGTQ